MKSTEEAAYWDDYYQKIRLDVMRESLNSTSFHAVYNDVTRYSYREELFGRWIVETDAKTALIIGAGIDKIGLRLAERGIKVCSVDLSPKAGELTMRLATEKGVAGQMECLSLDWEHAQLDRKFDLIVCHDALHHMHIEPAIQRISEHLGPFGTALGMEPMCPLDGVRKIHKVLPFYPFPKLETERELEPSDLRCIERVLDNVEFRFSDFLTRESLSVLLYRCGIRDGLTHLGKLDAWLLSKLTPMNQLASYVMFRATRR